MASEIILDTQNGQVGILLEGQTEVVFIQPKFILDGAEEATVGFTVEEETEHVDKFGLFLTALEADLEIIQETMADGAEKTTALYAAHNARVQAYRSEAMFWTRLCELNPNDPRLSFYQARLRDCFNEIARYEALADNAFTSLNSLFSHLDDAERVRIFTENSVKHLSRVANLAGVAGATVYGTASDVEKEVYSLIVGVIISALAKAGATALVAGVESNLASLLITIGIVALGEVAAGYISPWAAEKIYMYRKQKFYQLTSNVNIAIVGEAGVNNYLLGDGGNEVIFGRESDDTLYGGGGRNILDGGEGYDVYHISSAGFSTIIDGDKSGVVKYVKDNNEIVNLGAAVSLVGDDGAAGFYRDGNGLLYNLIHGLGFQSDRLVIYDENRRRIAEIEDFENGDLGIILVSGSGNSPAGQLILPPGQYDKIMATGSTADATAHLGDMADYVFGGFGNENYYLEDGHDFASGGFGNDLLSGGNGNDCLISGPVVGTVGDRQDHDVLIGGRDSDLLSGGLDNDVIFSDDPDNPDDRPAEALGDWVMGGAGDDDVTGSGQRDFINGGAGQDTLRGGAGDDVILGDGNYSFKWQGVALPTAHYIAGHYEYGVWIPEQEIPLGWWHNLNVDGTWTSSRVSESTVIDPRCFQWGIAFNELADGRVDFELIPSSLGYGTNNARLAVDDGDDDDYILAGAGNDWAAGQAGADYIDGGDGDDILYGDDVESMSPVASDSGADTIIGGQGSDRLYGGDGDDILYADAVGDYESGAGMGYFQYMNRQLMIIADGAEDHLYGGAGNDLLYAGTGGDKLYGEDGNDALYAGANSNGLLDGGSADDLLVVGSGSGNVFKGGEHLDTYQLTVNDLLESSGTDAFIDSDGLWRLSLGGFIISGDSPDLKAVAAGRWRYQGLELEVDGDDLILRAYNSSGAVQGKQIVFQNAVNQTGFQNLRLPPYLPENHAPDINNGLIEDQTVETGQSFSLVLPNDMFTDQDGDSLSYVATLANHIVLPSWLHFDENTLTLSGTAPSEEGSFTIRIASFDGRDVSDNVFFEINVIDDGSGSVDPGTGVGTNSAPELANSFAPQKIKVGQNFTWTLPAEAFSDPDDDELSYLVSNLPSWLSYDAETFTLSGTPTAAGNFSVAFKAFDGALHSETGYLNINVNSLPTLNRLLADRTIYVNQFFSFSIPLDTFTDGDGDALNYLVSNLPSWLSYNAQSRTLSGTPTDTGDFTLNIAATDGLEASETTSFTITVNQVSGNVINGTPGDDVLNGTSGADLIYGGEGVDAISGGNGDDLLDGGAGFDTLAGGAGNDVFVFGQGYGHDTVDAYDPYSTKIDKIRLAGLTQEDVEFGLARRVVGSNTYYDLQVRIKATGETLTVLNGGAASINYQIQAVEFADGTSLSWEEVRQAGLHG
ncbi:MAG: putative Ig domain-containing protein, partial [Candidatus Adiutrix sp.]|nr:putative Ig domain-containing protein [Candidatus Adiutrix sp.]